MSVSYTDLPPHSWNIDTYINIFLNYVGVRLKEKHESSFIQNGFLAAVRYRFVWIGLNETFREINFFVRDPSYEEGIAAPRIYDTPSNIKTMRIWEGGPDSTFRPSRSEDGSFPDQSVNEFAYWGHNEALNPETYFRIWLEVLDDIHNIFRAMGNINPVVRQVIGYGGTTTDVYNVNAGYEHIKRVKYNEQGEYDLSLHFGGFNMGASR
jgi:hypothetical protein